MKLERGLRPLLAAFCTAVSLVALGGCSDDVTCPGIEDGLEPSIIASAIEGVGTSGRFTRAEIFCTADPLPGALTTTINDRAFEASVAVSDPPGLAAALHETGWIWAPGIEAELSVTIDASGIATALEAVPDPPRPAAPAAASVGETLRIAWEATEGADYYDVRAVLKAARGDSLVLEASTRETTVVLTDSIAFAGAIEGRVAAVSGPLAEVGAEGNVSGFGWGFFTFSVYDSSSLFSTAVDDRAPRRDR